jgi:hypothetical protein
MRRSGSLVLLFTLGAMFQSPCANGAVVSIPSARDNTLFDLVADTLSSNGAGPYVLVGRNSQGIIRRGLLRFPVADSLPSGATIESVELRFHVSQSSGALPRTLAVHRLLADWGEGTSSSSGGGGASPTAGDATWLHRFFPDVAWSQPGGDYAAAPSATHAPGDNGDYVVTGSQMVLDVAEWLAAPAGNFGWVLLGDESAVSTARRIHSRENPATGTRPVLVITYTAPDVPVSPATWSRVKQGAGRPPARSGASMPGGRVAVSCRRCTGSRLGNPLVEWRLPAVTARGPGAKEAGNHPSKSIDSPRRTD